MNEIPLVNFMPFCEITGKRGTDYFVLNPDAMNSDRERLSPANERHLRRHQSHKLHVGFER